MSDLASVFGPKSWDDLRSLLSAYVSRRYYALSTEEVDDVVDEAVVDLVDYWAGVESSLTDDPDKNWNYAIKRARWTLGGFVWAVIERHTNEELFGVRDAHGGVDGADRGSRGGGMMDRISYERTMNAPYDDEDENSRKQREFLDNLPEAELERWLQSVLDGEEPHECAKRLGVTSGVIRKRRFDGRRRLRILVDSVGHRGLMKEDA